MDRQVSGPDRNLLTHEQVSEYMGISTDTLDTLIESKRFPQPFNVSKGRKMFEWMDVVAYLHLTKRIPGFIGEEKAAKGAT